MLEAWRAGRTLAEIAAEVGVTKQAVSRRLRRHATPGDRAQARRAQQDRRGPSREAVAESQAAEARQARREEADRLDLRCVVCGGRVHDSRRRTCGEGCAAEYQARPWRYSRARAERQRRESARTIRRHPARYTRAQRGWAERMLGPNPPAPNRGVHGSGS